MHVHDRPIGCAVQFIAAVEPFLMNSVSVPFT
jgi:hypothetical protein